MGNQILAGKSLPVRERGLKWSRSGKSDSGREVAPCAGAWIEIVSDKYQGKDIGVAPCAGAWIEML